VRPEVTSSRRRVRAAVVALCALLVGTSAASAAAVEVAGSSGGATSAAAPTVQPLAAANGYGPGVGVQTPSHHWGGAYTLANVPGYAYCIQPGSADPIELPTDQWSPIAYPGSSVYSNGEMAALAYFAERYQGSGYPGWSVDQTVAAIEQVAYGSAGGTTPTADQGPATLVDLIEQYMVTYAGPWTIQLSMTPSSGSTFDTSTNYSGTVTVTSATGNGVGGLQLTAPPTGGPGSNQISNFVWLAGTTNAAGQLSFQWNISGVPSVFTGAFSAQGIAVIGGAVGTAPPAYAPPAASGGQLMMVSGASETLVTSFGGVAQAPPPQDGTLDIEKSVPDAAYYGPAGAQFEIEDMTGNVLQTLTTNATGSAGPSDPLPASPSGTPYRVHETVAPTGYELAPDQAVTVYPSPAPPAVAAFTGSHAEPALVAKLGAAKIDAQTNAPLAGATFDFTFDPADNGHYTQDLGSCTTGPTGTCQPPEENATGGWLAGWYRITETASPSGYWLNPATATQTVFLKPGATALATVTFADDLLGSLQLTKSGNDTAYLPVAGAVFAVSGPSPSTTVVGTLTIGTSGTSGVLSGLVPGTYTVTETSAPPGYGTAPPFTVAVSAGHTTTSASVSDAVHSGAITVNKTDAATGDPLAGAVFDVRYDSTHDGTYDIDLGDCSTNASGSCTPSPNDGTGFLPGDYLVTEISAPPGYDLPTPVPSKVVEVAAGGSVAATFADSLLVPASFRKVATGSVNPTTEILSGAVIDLTSGTTYGGTVVATCTTDLAGACTTDATLISGDPYCWTEVSAPPGLEAGASGCFTATNSQESQPITLSDPGLFVGITVKKVDAQNPTAVLAGAVFDLYRVDVGKGPDSPTPPTTAPMEAGQTWVARATTGSDGLASFPLQFPGYAYCAVETQAPANYVPDTSEHCTGVLQGEGTGPTPVTTLTVTDHEATVTLDAYKFDSATPDTGIPGAVYDLYVEGEGPPSRPPTSPPSGVAAEQGDSWWARGTTDSAGALSFSVPSGYAWCLHEASAPPDYVADPGLHCTAVLTADTPVPATTVALPETRATVYLGAYKYNSEDPHTVIPGATYELLVQGTPPAGTDPPPAPSGTDVPGGDTYWTQGTTDAEGRLSFAVPAGYSWCLRELAAPSGYEADDSLHCTAVLTAGTATDPTSIALPEQPVPPAPVTVPGLAFTGGPNLPLTGGGLLLVVVGAVLTAFGNRRRRGDTRR